MSEREEKSGTTPTSCAYKHEQLIVFLMISLYVADSLFCLLGPKWEGVYPVGAFLYRSNLICLLGPPALLVYGWRLALLYFLGTVALVPLVRVVVFGHGTERRVVYLIFTIAFWCTCGAVSKLPDI